VAGGFIAQVTNLGVPYIVRSVLLGLTLVAAFLWMKDLGFTPDRSTGPLDEIRRVARSSIDNGWRNPPVRWLMLAGLCAGGVDMFAFYALQPYLLELYGNERAFGIAGLAAAIVAGTQMLAGLIAPWVHRMVSQRTRWLILMALIGSLSLAFMGGTSSLPVAIVVLAIWGLTFSFGMPIRQAYLNGLIPSQQRATVLSFDNLMASAGGAATQPALGRVADVWGYSTAYLVSAGIQLAAVPFLVLAWREHAPTDRPSPPP
jgi:MFS family permease